MSQDPANPSNPPSSPPPPGTPPAAPPGPGAPPTADPADVEKNKVFAVLAYLGLLVLVPILAAKESPFARYHANQGLILLICSFIAGFVLAIAAIILAFIPVIGWCASCVIYLAYLGGLLTLVILGILNAVNGRLKPLPVIGGLFTIIK